jgi:hypothetical protein
MRADYREWNETLVTMVSQDSHFFVFREMASTRDFPPELFITSERHAPSPQERVWKERVSEKSTVVPNG